MRIASDSIYSNVLRNIQKNQLDLDRLNQQISSGLQFRFPHEEPVKAVQSMQLRTDILRLDKFNENITAAKSTMEATDATLGNAVDLLQRARQLAVQAATGTLTESDRALVGLEVNQILEEMVSIGNAEFEGKFLFGGAETLDESFNENPFEVDRVGGNIVKVKYKGDTKDRFREITEGKFLSASIPGNRVFAAQNQSVTMGLTTLTSAVADDGVELGESVGVRTGKDATLDALIGANTGYFRIDGTPIYYDTRQDSLQDITDRINQANLQVKASIIGTSIGGGVTRYQMKLETTTPHQMEMVDIDRSTGTSAPDGLLDDLQIVEKTSYALTDPNQPDNIDPTAVENRVDVFQALINLRDDLDIKVGITNPDFVKRYGVDSNGDGIKDTFVGAPSAAAVAQKNIGGSSLSNLDAALDNLLVNRAVYGSRLNRLESAEGRNVDFKQNNTQLLQKVEDLDFATALTEFQQLQNVQRAAMATGARIFSLTLLDFV